MKFTAAVLSLSLLLSAARSSVELRARSLSGEDAVLRCPAEAEPGVRYRSVIWYKVSEAPSRQLSGLVLKRLTQSNGTVQRYKGLMRDVELLEDSQSLLLPNVTQDDAGRYLCLLSAPVGYQNQEREIHLTVYDHEENMREETRERNDEHENDTVFMVLAIILLMVALLMFYCSYVCLRNTLTRNKETFSKHALLKKTQHEMKHVIVSLKPNGIVSKILPEQQYV